MEINYGNSRAIDRKGFLRRIRRPSPRLMAVLLLAAVFAAGRDASAQNCDADHFISWPTANPRWQLCWVNPSNSSGIDGSGLEIHSVYYNGKLVLARGHIPVVNVKYDPGGCGGSNLSYRDWNNEEAVFEATNVIRSGYAEPFQPPKTVCDNPGFDIGSFRGVAAEKLPDRLILTTQMEAGWYRYVYTWTFFLDGSFKPGMRSTAVNNTCTPLPHYHNAYWRLDWDIDGGANDAIDEFQSGTWSGLTTEAQRLNSPGTGRKWRIRDKVTGSGYEVVPGPTDDVADSWSVADVWALQNHSTEFDDGGATGGANGDSVHLDQYVNGENIDGKDVVFWYRIGYRHEGSADCESGGPTLYPIVPSGLPLVSVADITMNEGNSGTANAVFNVTLSAPSSSTISVNYATADGTATAGSDYVAKSGVLTFLPGTVSQTISVTINGDTAVELDEKFAMNLSDVSNAVIGDGQAEGTILNDDGLAVYSSTLKAPQCTGVGNVCDSASLLNGRDGKGPEPNQPNTINNSCTDGTSGIYHDDESLDRLRVSTLDGSLFAAGKMVRVEATVWAWRSPSADKLDLYYAANANSPSWTFITTLMPPAAGVQTLSATYTLPSGALQAVRGRFRYQGSASACGTGGYDDHDDLIFAVDAPAPDTQSPTTAITAPADGASVSGTLTITASAIDNVGVSKVEFYVDSVLRSTDTTSPYSYDWNTTTFANGNHSIFSKAYDAANNTGTSAIVNVTVNNLPSISIGDVTINEGNSGTTSASLTVSLSSASGSTVSVNYATADGTATAGSDYVAKSGSLTFMPGAVSQTISVTVNGDTTVEPDETFMVNLSGPSNAVIGDGQGLATIRNDDTPPTGLAVYNATLRAPHCATVGSGCDSGASLLNGRDGKGPEPNQPNTIANSCADGTQGTYHVDESVDRLKVSTLDGTSLEAGKTVRVDATIWAWTTPSADRLELYRAANANSPSWQLIATLTPTVAGAQTLSATYALPSGTLQAVRARIRYQGSAGACGSGGGYTDHDDLVFAVQ